MSQVQVLSYINIVLFLNPMVVEMRQHLSQDFEILVISVSYRIVRKLLRHLELAHSTDIFKKIYKPDQNLKK